MQIVPEAALRGYIIQSTFRESSARFLLAFIGCCAAGFVSSWLILQDNSKILAVLAGGTLVLIGLCFLFGFFESLYSNNWCVKLSENEILVKLGNFQKKDNISKVMVINLHEIGNVSICKIHETRKREEYSAQRTLYSFICIELQNEFPASARYEIESELKYKKWPTPADFCEPVPLEFRNLNLNRDIYTQWPASLEYPVLLPHGKVMVRWSSPFSSITPSANKFIKVIESKGVRTQPASEEFLDYTG
jgi:hypothetical protein